MTFGTSKQAKIGRNRSHMVRIPGYSEIEEIQRGTKVSNCPCPVRSVAKEKVDSFDKGWSMMIVCVQSSAMSIFFFTDDCPGFFLNKAKHQSVCKKKKKKSAKKIVFRVMRGHNPASVGFLNLDSETTANKEVKTAAKI